MLKLVGAIGDDSRENAKKASVRGVALELLVNLCHSSDALDAMIAHDLHQHLGKALISADSAVVKSTLPLVELVLAVSLRGFGEWLNDPNSLRLTTMNTQPTCSESAVALIHAIQVSAPTAVRAPYLREITNRVSLLWRLVIRQGL